MGEITVVMTDINTIPVTNVVSSKPKAEAA
jgi:hypothetical protein